MQKAIDYVGRVDFLPTISPDEKTVYVTVDSGITAFDEKTGVKAWEFKAESYVHNPPVFDREGNIYMGCNNARLYVYSDNYGKMKANPIEEMKKQGEDIQKSDESPGITQGKGFVDIGGVKLQINS